MNILFTLLALIISGIFAFESFAKNKGLSWNSDKGWGVSSQYGKLYNTKSLETIKGEVIGVEEVRPYSGMRAGIHLIVKTATDQASVHLGPAWYILNQGVKFKVTDMIEVTGSRISFANKHVLVAKEVIKDKTHIQLRDETGIPFWCSQCIPKKTKYSKN